MVANNGEELSREGCEGSGRVEGRQAMTEPDNTFEVGSLPGERSAEVYVATAQWPHESRRHQCRGSDTSAVHFNVVHHAHSNSYRFNHRGIATKRTYRTEREHLPRQLESVTVKSSAEGDIEEWSAFRAEREKLEIMRRTDQPENGRL